MLSYSLLRRIGFVVHWCLMCMAMPAFSGVLNYHFPVDPRVIHYRSLLEQPGLLAIALENAGEKIAYSGRLRVANLQEFRIEGVLSLGDVLLRAEKANTESEIVYSAAVAGVSAPIFLDLSSLQAGVVGVRLSVPAAGVLPEKVESMVGEKLGHLMGLGVQGRLIDYLDGILKDKPSNLDEQTWLTTQILLMAYGRQVTLSDGMPVNCGTQPIWGKALPWLVVAVLLFVVFNLAVGREAARSGQGLW